MKLNRKLVLIAAVLMSVVMGTTGTIAYLQDTDSAVNVMTLGNVKIEQYEYQRAERVAYDAGEQGECNGVQEGALVPFEQGQGLYPAVPKNNVSTDYSAAQNVEDLFFWGDYVYSGTAGNGLWNDNNLSNVMDKMVFVENTGKSDAYVRTIIAFECPEGMEYGVQPYTQECEFMMNTNAASYEWESIDYVTVDGVRYLVEVATYKNILASGNQSHPSLLQVVMTHNATNEDMDLLGDTYDILVLSQAVQTAGFEAVMDGETVVKTAAQNALDTAFGEANEENVIKWFGDLSPINAVKTAAELQAALDAAEDGTTIVLGADITGNVTVTQKENVKLTIEGANHKFDGVILVDGKSATITTAGLNIKNVIFEAESISADAFIRLGDGTNATRYTCNVTVENCTFNGATYTNDEGEESGAVGIKSYTGGDKNLSIINCTVDKADSTKKKMHSLVQAKGVDGVLVKDCKVYSKNGLNFNNSDNVTVQGCTVDTVGYAVRFGESSGGVGAAETYLIKDCTLKSANDDGDATIILRGTADYSTLTIENTTIVGTPDIANTATGATVKK